MGNSHEKWGQLDPDPEDVIESQKKRITELEGALKVALHSAGSKKRMLALAIYAEHGAVFDRHDCPGAHEWTSDGKRCIMCGIESWET